MKKVEMLVAREGVDVSEHAIVELTSGVLEQARTSGQARAEKFNSKSWIWLVLVV
jgi:hypothetical protein